MPPCGVGPERAMNENDGGGVAIKKHLNKSLFILL
jgi:hypothetical protein